MGCTTSTEVVEWETHEKLLTREKEPYSRLRIKIADVHEAYEFEAGVVGCGFGGFTKSAICRVTGRKVHVKTVSRAGESALAQQSNMALMKEISSLGMVDHPNVIRLLEVWISKGDICTVYEYCSGGTLYDQLALCGGRMDENTVRWYVVQMLLALKHLDDMNIIHRDIKLENWGLTDTGIIKLLDFGFSRHHEHNDLLRAACGTPAYVSPEMLTGGYNNLTDLWSLGVCVYILLTGTPPFTAPTDEELWDTILRQEPDFGKTWDTISPSCSNFVMTLLSDMTDRMTVQQALAHDWVVGAVPKPDPINGVTFQMLRTFSELPRLQRIVRLLVALGSTQCELDDVYVPTISMISLEEFEDLMEDPGADSSDLSVVFNALDHKGDGYCRYSDMVAALMQHTDRASLELVFRKLDVLNNGRVTSGALSEVFRDLYTADAMEEAIPQDGLSLEDFINSMSSFLVQ